MTAVSPQLLYICLTVWSELAIKSASGNIGQLYVVHDLVASFHLALRDAVCNHNASVYACSEQKKFVGARQAENLCRLYETAAHDGSETLRNMFSQIQH